MRNLDDLAGAIAEIDGRESSEIASLIRRLRDVGCIGAGEPCARDAANAIIAINGAIRAADMAAALTEFRGLEGRLLTGLESEAHMPDQVIDARNFGEAVEGLIRMAPAIEESFRKFVDEAMATDPAALIAAVGLRVGGAISLQVQFHTSPYRAAAVRVEALLAQPDPFGRRRPKRETLFETVYAPSHIGRVEDGQFDRRVSVILGLRTFTALHTAVASLGANENSGAGRILRFPIPVMASVMGERTNG
jgi:hypothetical protein